MEFTKEDEHALLKTIDDNVRTTINELYDQHTIKMDAWARDVSVDFSTNAREAAKIAITPKWFYVLNAIINGLATGASLYFAAWLAEHVIK